jgi:hypothetical protein
MCAAVPPRVGRLTISYLDPRAPFSAGARFPGPRWRPGLFHLVIELGADPIVVDHIATVLVEQSEQPPQGGSEATRLAGDPHDMASPINVPGLVEIVGKRDLLAASVA